MDGNAQFEETSFEIASFADAQFWGYIANYRNAKFGAVSDFRNVHFDGTAVFDDTSFRGIGIFHETSFELQARFANADFGTQQIDFRGVLEWGYLAPKFDWNEHPSTKPQNVLLD